jgi:two-component system, chemotaxis family, chemotaxis protein CheY
MTDPIHILLIDDSAFARRKLRQVLETEAHTIHEAASGAEALEKYAMIKPRLVFLDLVMEGMDGLEVLARLRQIDPNAIVVIASADIQSATRDEAFKLGATDFINKPFDAIEVLAAVLRGTGRTLIPCSTVAAC